MLAVVPVRKASPEVGVPHAQSEMQRSVGRLAGCDSALVLTERGLHRVVVKVPGLDVQVHTPFSERSCLALKLSALFECWPSGPTRVSLWLTCRCSWNFLPSLVK